MLIEQTTEFQMKGPGPLRRTCNPITGNLHNKTKILKENLREDYYLLQSIAGGNVPYFPL